MRIYPYCLLFSIPASLTHKIQGLVEGENFSPQKKGRREEGPQLSQDHPDAFLLSVFLNYPLPAVRTRRPICLT